MPRTRLGEALAEIDRMSAEAGIRVANVFHAGDGNLHPLILFDGRDRGAVERAHDLAGEILRLCIALGGSITGEHGVGVEKRAFLPLMFSEDDLELMRRVRRSVDPAELANRGKMLEPERHERPDPFARGDLRRRPGTAGGHAPAAGRRAARNRRCRRPTATMSSCSTCRGYAASSSTTPPS